RAVQLSGTDAWKTLPPLISRNWDEGRGTGCPGVPTDLAVSPPPPPPAAFPRSTSAIDLPGGMALNAILIGWNWLVSAALAIVSVSASLVMYTVLLPGFG